MPQRDVYFLIDADMLKITVKLSVQAILRKPMAASAAIGLTTFAAT
jgi:hypothetical protein